MKKNVLVTGAFGYLGGRIAKLLAHDPDVVVHLGTRDGRRSPPEWIGAGKVTAMDLGSRLSLDAACRGMDAIVHLAAVNEVECASDPQGALEVNGLGALRLLEAAQTRGVTRFVYLSTIHVYGSPLAGVITERTLPRPRHPYAITHRVAEDFVLAAHDTGRLTGIVLRLSNGFGAPALPDADRWTLVVNDLCRQAVTTGRLILKTPGLQKRDFITLHDTARAVAHVLKLAGPDCGDGLFNLGGEYVSSILDVANLIARRCEATLGHTPPLERPDPTPGERVDDLEYRIDRMKGTGFSLAGDVEAEIDATLRFCASHFGAGEEGRR
jgi:UDP-glucose 4-epimerase